MKNLFASLAALIMIISIASSCTSSSNDFTLQGTQATICRAFENNDLTKKPEASATLVQMVANVSAGTLDLSFACKLKSNLSVVINATNLSLTSNNATGCYEFHMSPNTTITAGQNTVTDIEGLINSVGGSIRLTMTVNGSYKVYITSPTYLYCNTVVSQVDNSAQPYEANNIYYEFIPDPTTMTGQLYIANFHLGTGSTTSNTTMLDLPYEVTPNGYHIATEQTTQITASSQRIVNEVTDLDITIDNQGQTILGSFIANGTKKVTFNGTVFPAQYK